MTDIARILTAAHLGLSATAILLLCAALLGAAKGPRRALATVGLFVVATASTVAVMLRGDARTITALDGLPLFVALSMALLAPPVRAVLRALPLAALVTTPALRLAGMDALLAARAGWLPAHFAWTAAAIEGACGAGAVALTVLAARRGDKATRAIAIGSAASLVGALATTALAWRGVRPLPTFLGVYLGALLPLCAAMHAAAIAALRGGETAR